MILERLSWRVTYSNHAVYWALTIRNNSPPLFSIPQNPVFWRGCFVVRTVALCSTSPIMQIRYADSLVLIFFLFFAFALFSYVLRLKKKKEAFLRLVYTHVQLTSVALTDWVVMATRWTIQQKSSASLISGRPLGAILKRTGMSTL